MKISLIYAANLDGIIGNDNKLLWHLPEDLKRFKSLTMGKPIVMGRKTFESIGKPLPGRTSIVITRNPGFQQNGVIVCGSVEEALVAAKEIGADEVFVIGGGEIYRLFLPYSDKIYFTRVHNHKQGDTSFNIPDKTEWKLVSSEFHKADEKHESDFEFLDLARRNPELSS